MIFLIINDQLINRKIHFVNDKDKKSQRMVDIQGVSEKLKYKNMIILYSGLKLIIYKYK